jgi:hypothetical protein
MTGFNPNRFTTGVIGNGCGWQICDHQRNQFRDSTLPHTIGLNSHPARVMLSESHEAQ